MLNHEQNVTNQTEQSGLFANATLRLKTSLKDLVVKRWAPENKADIPEKQVYIAGELPSSFRRPVIALGQRKLEQTKQSELITKRSNSYALYSYQVPIMNLPSSMHNLKILHISDPHFIEGDDKTRKMFSRLIYNLVTSKVQYDIVVITGDIITKSIYDLSLRDYKNLEILRDNVEKAYFVLGNHDYHGHKSEILANNLESIGIKNLTNDKDSFIRNSQKINFYGIDDYIFGTPIAPADVNENEVNIMLMHNLDALWGTYPDYFDLTLSGHTHWGETKLFNGVRIMSKWGYADGINGQTMHWDTLSDRNLSFVHPGLARYYATIPGLNYAPGFVSLRLVGM